MTEKYTPEEWEHLRMRFFNSILNETEIAKLGQNVGISWPFKESDETPLKYIDLDFEELQQVPGLIGKKKRVQILMDILRETLAFDDPFGDMVDTVEAESQEDDTFERILAKLNIPTNFPVALIQFEKGTHELLQNEEVTDLLGVVHFGQTLARNVVIGGDLKTFLNCLAHKDEVGIKKHLPYRNGQRGLHLPEAFGLIADNLKPAVKLEVLHDSGLELTDDEHAERGKASALIQEGALKVAGDRVKAICDWFSSEASELEQVLTTGGSPERYFIPINDARVERVAVVLAKLHFGISDKSKGGLFGKISGLFGR